MLASYHLRSVGDEDLAPKIHRLSARSVKHRSSGQVASLNICVNKVRRVTPGKVVCTRHSLSTDGEQLMNGDLEKLQRTPFDLLNLIMVERRFG